MLLTQKLPRNNCLNFNSQVRGRSNYPFGDSFHPSNNNEGDIPRTTTKSAPSSRCQIENQIV